MTLRVHRVQCVLWVNTERSTVKRMGMKLFVITVEGRIFLKTILLMKSGLLARAETNRPIIGA